MAGKIIGIDLGTTYSAMACLDDNNKPIIVLNAEEEATTPSAVLIEDGDTVVGQLALNQAISKADNVARWAKRAIGDADWQFQGMTAVEISAEILKKLKADATVALGEPVTDAVITCPAYFSGDQIEDTRAAGELAEFNVLEIIKEPTAAAIYYGVAKVKPGEHLLVCDLGGGTYDATVLSVQESEEAIEFRPLATLGDAELGGHDWTMALVDHVGDEAAELFGEDPRGEPEFDEALYHACEQKKRDFLQATKIIIPLHHAGKTIQITVDRELFEDITEHLIVRMIGWTSQVVEKATDVNREHGRPAVTWDDIDYVLLVGGSTRLRRVSEAIEELTGKKPIQTGKEDTMVALGAAMMTQDRIQAAPIRGGLVARAEQATGGLIDAIRICERNLGTKVIVQDNGEARIENSVIISFGTDLPASGTRDDFETWAPNQASFDVPIVEFDDYGQDVIHDTYRFLCLPGTPAKSGMTVTFSYSKEAGCSAAAVDQRTGQELESDRVTYVEPEDIVAVAPRAVVFALDISVSMEGDKLENAKRAVIDSAEQQLVEGGGNVQVGVIMFGSGAETVCDLTTDLGIVKAAVAPIGCSGSTRMDLGILEALALLRNVPAEVTKDIAMVTDGMPDDDSLVHSARDDVLGTGVRLLAVGLVVDNTYDVDEDFLSDLTAGQYLMIEDAGEIGGGLGSLLAQSSPHQPAFGGDAGLREVKNE